MQKFIRQTRLRSSSELRRRGYDYDYRPVTAMDAIDFIYTLSEGIVIDISGGRYRAPRSKADEVIFWEGSKAFVPRPITL